MNPERASVHLLPLAWAEQLITNGGDDFPTYRTREWMELDDRDPRKVAACVQAAEKWATWNYQPVEAWPLQVSTRRTRAIAEARRPRPGDHPGGPVSWERQAVDG